MPFGQKYGSYLRSGFGQAKQFLGNAYSTGKHVLGTADKMVGRAQQLYGILQPAMQAMAPQQMQGALQNFDAGVGKGLQGYSNIRSKIDDAEGKAMGKIAGAVGSVQGVAGNLRKANFIVKIFF